MIRAIIMAIAVIVASLGLDGTARAQGSADRLVAVGDLHGDYDAWLRIARDARLIDDKGRWAGGRTTLVQLGDVADRGPDSLKIIQHLRQLQKEAKRSRGQVIVLVGNHEAMLVSGDYRYVHPGEYEAFVTRRSRQKREATFRALETQLKKFYQLRDPEISDDQVREKWFAETPLGKVEHNIAWSPKGELGKWAASLPAVVKVGDTVFVHGGISASYALVPIPEINRRVREALMAGSTELEAATNDQMGPLWYRGLVLGTGAGGRPTAENELTVALKAMGAKRMVIGHTPSLEGIVDDFDGRLVRIDTGISSHYGGPLSWLEINGGKVTQHHIDRGS